MKLVSRLTPHFGLTATLVLFVSIQGDARASTEIQKELVDVAKNIASVLEQKNENRIAVGQFSGPSRMPSSSGPSIAKALSEELTKLGIMVNKRASLEIKGDYLAVVSEKNRGPAALLKGRVLDASGNVVYEFEKGFSNDITVASMFGITVDLPPDDSPRDRRQKIRESIDQPKASIAQSRIATSTSSPYAVEVLVKSGSDWLPRGATDDEGLAYVPIKPDETYAVLFHNDSPYDAAVTLTIDGLSMFSFSQNASYRQLGYVIIGAKSTGTIYGWHRTNEVSDSFLVTEYAKSAAAELKQTSDLGTITCSVSAAWPVDGLAPPDETRRGDNATGRGPEIAAKYKEIQRVIGRTRAAISCRYTKPTTP